MCRNASGIWPRLTPQQQHAAPVLFTPCPQRCRDQACTLEQYNPNYLDMSMLKDDEGHRKVFDLRSPTQLLAKLEWETQQVKELLATEDPKAVFAAFNAAATAWHITDWIRTYSRVHPRETLNIDHKAYRGDAISRCPNLEI